MCRLKSTLLVIICASLLFSATFTGCGRKNTQEQTSETISEHSDTISGDILSTGGNFTKIVVMQTSGNTDDTTVNKTEPTNQDQEQTESVIENPALRPNIGLASMNLSDLVGGLNVSEDLSGKADESEITLDGYTKYSIKYTEGYTVNDFDKDIRYFCWSLPESTAVTFVNALGEICSELGYLLDEFKVTKNTYHTKDYEYYVYEIKNSGHVINLAINYNNTKEVYYTNRDK